LPKTGEGIKYRYESVDGTIGITSHVISLLVIFPLVLVIANALVLVLLVLVRYIWPIWIYS
tara:strand:+ start:1260 stop:1442 length:183 start_codon:yes stop_codon:yes gene_type:complete